MILYRVLSDYELKKLRGLQINDKPSILMGNNTFKYEKGVEYMHFYKYAEHAQKHKNKFGVCIAKVDIDDSLIEQEGFGYYGGQGDLVPECIIKRENFDIRYIKEISDDIKREWCAIKGSKTTYGELYNLLLNDLNEQLKKEKKFEYFNIYVVKQLKDKNLDDILLTYLNKTKNR